MAKDFDILQNFSKALIDNGDGTFSLRVGGTGLDDRYLKLDQTTVQSIINGAPVFTKGLVISAGERLVFDG